MSNNTKPKRHVRTIGTNVGQAILDAGFEHPRNRKGKRPGKPRRRPQQSAAKASPALKPATPSAAAAMARMAGKGAK
jgi:hypothetical protein